MRYPRELYQMTEAIAEHLPELRPAQQRGLALWVYGTVMAHSACQNAVLAALLVYGGWHNLRQQLREWLYDGQDKAAPCATQVEMALFFGPLLGWVLSWWQGTHLALAIDATNHKDRLVVLSVSVLYRGSAIPVAWHILPANQQGPWMGHILRLLRLLHRRMPPGRQVLVMVDRGLRSTALWKRIRDLGWHPLLRLQNNTSVQPVGAGRQRAQRLVAGPGYGWIGPATVFRAKRKQRKATLVVIWAQDEKEPWVLMTDLAPERVGIWWYSLRVWVELGFRVLKSMGWRWEHTRRVAPERVSRHWLVLAVATLWVMACGTRAEDAELAGVAPANMRGPRQPQPGRPPADWKRVVSVFQRGLAWFRRQLDKGRLWRRLWLAPEPWPEPPPGISVTFYACP